MKLPMVKDATGRVEGLGFRETHTHIGWADKLLRQQKIKNSSDIFSSAQ
jgi:hypothetical protein